MTHCIDLTGTRPIIPELIPEKMWNKNVRTIISKQNWETLRWSFGAAKHPPPFALKAVTDLGLPRPSWHDEIRCQICGQEQDNLELYELWEYDDERYIQNNPNIRLKIRFFMPKSPLQRIKGDAANFF
jgi:hypothetical protein